MKSNLVGQVDNNISKLDISQERHCHHSKNERVLVVKGEVVIQFRDIFSEEIIEYYVSDQKLQVADI